MLHTQDVVSLVIDRVLPRLLGWCCWRIDGSYSSPNSFLALVQVDWIWWDCHGEYGPTLNWSGTIFGCRKWSPRTNYGCHKRSPPAITGPGRTIGGNKIRVTKRVRTIKECISNLGIAFCHKRSPLR